MPRYDQYKLSNSRQVRPFAGSSLPELTSVAGALQERFDKTLENEDLLSRAIRNSQAAPFEKDQQLLGQLKQQFKARIDERAKQGNYEDMYRATMLDSRDFIDQYQPIVENAKRYEEYKNQLNQSLAKGDIKSPDKARRLLALSTQNYKGLEYDPVTGSITNRFQGLPSVKDIDPTEKVDKWMKDIAPTVLGSEVKWTDGVWKRYKEGKLTTLTSDEIGRVMDAGRRLDPEFNAWLDQEKQLSSVDIAHLTDADIQKRPDSPFKAQIVSEATRTGKSLVDVLRQFAAAEKEDSILGNMSRYANKYIRDDRQTGYGILGADEYNLQRTGKKIEDEAMVLSMPILQPEARAEINGAEDLLTKVGEAGKAVQATRQSFDNWVTQNGLRPDGKGNWVDAQGNDKTLKYLEQKQVLQQAEHAWQNYQKLDAEANRRSGFGKGTITPELIQKAEHAASAAVGEARGYGLNPTNEEVNRIYQQAKADYLRQNSPGYAQKDQIIKDMTKQGAQVVNAQTFNSKTANTQAENLFKSFVLNLDASGLKAGTQGLQWATGDNAGKSLESRDYKKVAADAVFAGYGMDTDGQLKFYYKVGSVKQNNKGETVGSEELVKMPALPGTTEILIKNKQTDQAQLILGQQINQIMNNPNGGGSLDVGNGKQIQVQRVDQNQLQTGAEVSPGINLRFPTSDGKYTEIKAGSVGEAINMITNILHRSANRQKQ